MCHLALLLHAFLGPAALATKLATCNQRADIDMPRRCLCRLTARVVIAGYFGQ